MTRILFIGLACILVVSCNKSTDCYSCDVNVDAFVKQNETELREMSVTELVGYNPEVQKAAFRMYDPHKRQKIWEEKYDHILRNNPNDYSVKELSAIGELSGYIIEKGIHKTRDSFINKWIEQARKHYLWSDDRLRFLIMSLDVDEENYLRNHGIKKSSNPDYHYCQCNISSDGLFLKDCPYSGECSKENSKCEKKRSGCGIFFWDPCNGECQPNGGWPERNPKN